MKTTAALNTTDPKTMENAIDAHVQAVTSLRRDLPLLSNIAAAIIDAFRARRRLYVFGNGGSAADSQHIAAELLGRFKRDRRALPATALTVDTSTLTAVGNDLGFENVFKRQVEALVSPGDVVWALSVSGASPNVLAALAQAKKQGAFIVGFTSRRGVEMTRLCDLCLLADADADAGDRVQEVHEIAYHLVCERVEAAFAEA